MRTVFVVALSWCLAWSAGEYTIADHVEQIANGSRYPLSYELSRDNGNIQSAWCYLNGAGTYAGEQYDTPTYPSNPWWYLSGIKYFVWSQGWPDSVYQGFGVACWKMYSGVPGNVIWPPDGVPQYNPNSGGNWIIVGGTNPYVGLVNISLNAPQGFIVGIEFLYTYPEEDAYGVDNTGSGPYDWAYAGGTWQAAPYGKGSARALVGYAIPMNVETKSLGEIRILFH